MPPDRLLQDWKQAHERALAYLAALGVPRARARRRWRAQAVERAVHRAPTGSPDGDAIAETLRALRALLVGARSRSIAGAAARRHRRVRSPGACAAADGAVASDAARRRAAAACARSPVVDAAAHPPPMVPERIERRFVRRLFDACRGGAARAGAARAHASSRAAAPPPAVDPRRAPPPPAARRSWSDPEHRRQRLHARACCRTRAQTWLELAIVLFFGALFGWISIGFWTAVLGFFTLVIAPRDRFAITNLERPAASRSRPAAAPRS